MLRIAHIITDLQTGGAEVMLLRLLQRMDRARYAAEVFSLRQTQPIGDRIAELGVPVRALHLKKVPNPAGLVKLTGWLRAGRFDVVQTWMTHADLIGGMAAAAAGRLPVAWGLHVGKIDVAVHGRAALWTARVNALLSRRVPARIVCCSETSRQEHAQLGYDAGRMVVIPNGFDLSVFRPSPAARELLRAELGAPASAPLIGHVGRFHPQKDHRNLVEAARRVLARHQHARFVLAGKDLDWDNAALAGWVRDAGIADRFHLLGPRDDVPRLMAAFDVAVSSSSFGEAFPLVIGEAMASGVPCAVTDCGDSRLMVGDTGRVAPVQDAEALAQAITSLLSLDADARAALGRAARQRIEERYALDAIVARYHTLYDELAGFSQ
jgi:glycosyltransferase involved in cell wall biosynthesis